MLEVLLRCLEEDLEDLEDEAQDEVQDDQEDEAQDDQDDEAQDEAQDEAPDDPEDEAPDDPEDEAQDDQKNDLLMTNYFFMFVLRGLIGTTVKPLLARYIKGNVQIPASTESTLELHNIELKQQALGE